MFSITTEALAINTNLELALTIVIFQLITILIL